MPADSGRPFLVWFALASLILLAVWNVNVTPYILSSGSEGAFEFFSTLAFVAIAIAAIFGIYSRASWGRQFAILSFITSGILSSLKILLLMNSTNLRHGRVFTFILIERIVLIMFSFAFAFSFVVSGIIKRYFNAQDLPGN